MSNTGDQAAASMALGRAAFADGEPPPMPVPGEYRDDCVFRLVGYVDALADAVRDLTTAIRLLAGVEDDENVDIEALRERLAQIKPRDG